MKRKNNQASESFEPNDDSGCNDAFLYELEEFDPTILYSDNAVAPIAETVPKKARKRKRKSKPKGEEKETEIEQKQSTKTISDWGGMVFHPKIMDTITKLGFIAPTPIQSKAIPPAIKGQSILCSAATGSGKTLAYLLPILNNIFTSMDSPDYHPSHTALILLPSRELANQVHNVCREFAKSLSYPHSNNLSCLIVGGMSEDKQIRQLNDSTILISTPGRLAPLRSHVSFESIKYLVFDEVDKLLTLDNRRLHFAELEMICEVIVSNRQVMCYSATLNDHLSEIKFVIKKKLNIKDVSFTCIIQDVLHSPNVKTNFFEVYSTQEDKDMVLLSILNSNYDASHVLIYCESVSSTRHVKDVTASCCNQDDNDVKSIYSDMSQKSRYMAYEWFNKSNDDVTSRKKILITSNLTGRGIHFDHISLMIHYDISRTMDEWVHRIGRLHHTPVTDDDDDDKKRVTSISIITPSQHSRHELIKSNYQFNSYPVKRSDELLHQLSQVREELKIKRKSRINAMELDWSRRVMNALDIDNDDDDEEEETEVTSSSRRPISIKHTTSPHFEQLLPDRRRSKFINVARDVYHVDHLNTDKKKVSIVPHVNEKLEVMEARNKKMKKAKRNAKRDKASSKKEARKTKRGFVPNDE